MSRLSFAVDDRGQDVDGVVDQRHGSHARTSPIVVKNLVRRIGARHGVRCDENQMSRDLNVITMDGLIKMWDTVGVPFGEVNR